jgi:hypothetical protein
VLKSEGLAAFTSKSALDYIDTFQSLAQEYEWIRQVMPAGGDRTEQMDLLVGRAQVLAGQRDAGTVAERLFKMGTEGSRVIAIALARSAPERRHLDMALESVSRSKSAFEQFHALLLIRSLIKSLDPSSAQQVRSAVEEQIGKTITRRDLSRWKAAEQILEGIGVAPGKDAWSRSSPEASVSLGAWTVILNECRPSMAYVRYDDVEESTALS